MTAVPRRTREWTGVSADALPLERLIAEQVPTVLKGAAAGWPLVAAGLDGTAAAYLKRFDAGRPLTTYVGRPEDGGRFFYDEAISGLNFERRRMAMGEVLDAIASHRGDPRPPFYYVGSTDLDTYLPGLRDENDLSLPPRAPDAAPPLVSLWMGNRTIASTHYDMSNNLAACAVGGRRFTLFPPDQVANLYPGPLEPTPGGQVVSMVDLRAPDLHRYPRFSDALAAAEVAELEPGDVLFYPALWWHNVEALGDFNAMINWWWNDAPAHLDTPMTTLLHGLLSLRDRPAAEKRAWATMFDYYVFGEAGRAAAHLPDHAQGELAPMDAIAARRLRGKLLGRMNR